MTEALEEIPLDEVDKKIAALSKEEQIRFYDELKRVCEGDEYWFKRTFGPSWRRFYSNMNSHMLEIKETLYQEEFAPKPGGTDGEEGAEAYGQMFKRHECNRTA